MENNIVLLDSEKLIDVIQYEQDFIESEGIYIVSIFESKKTQAGVYVLFEIENEGVSLFLPHNYDRKIYLRLNVKKGAKYGISRLISLLLENNLIEDEKDKVNENFANYFKVKTHTLKSIKIINTFVHKDMIDKKEIYTSRDQFLSRFNKEYIKAFFELRKNLKHKDVSIFRFDTFKNKVQTEYTLTVEFNNFKYHHTDYKVLTDKYIRGIDYYELK